MTDHRAEYYQATSTLPRSLSETWDAMAAWKSARIDAHDRHGALLASVVGSTLPPVALRPEELPPIFSPAPPFKQKHLRKIRQMPPSRYERLCPPPIDWRTP